MASLSSSSCQTMNTAASEAHKNEPIPTSFLFFFITRHDLYTSLDGPQATACIAFVHPTANQLIALQDRKHFYLPFTMTIRL